MFEKFKNILNLNVVSKIEYVVNIKVFEEYLRQNLQFSIENNLEACVDINLYYKGEKHAINIFNFGASSSKKEQEKGISVMFDNVEYKTIDNFLNTAVINNTKLIDFKDYFVIKLLYMDDAYLNEFRDSHTELKVEDYK